MLGTHTILHYDGPAVFILVREAGKAAAAAAGHGAHGGPNAAKVSDFT